MTTQQGETPRPGIPERQAQLDLEELVTETCDTLIWQDDELTQNPLPDPGDMDEATLKKAEGVYRRRLNRLMQLNQRWRLALRPLRQREDDASALVAEIRRRLERLRLGEPLHPSTVRGLLVRAKLPVVRGNDWAGEGLVVRQEPGFEEDDTFIPKQYQVCVRYHHPLPGKPSVRAVWERAIEEARVTLTDAGLLVRRRGSELWVRRPKPQPETQEGADARVQDAQTSHA